jgi:hypothetical protein
MNELENNNLEADLMPAKKQRAAFGTEVELTPLEASIQARKHNLNFPALQSMFELNEAELQSILDKLPPLEDCNC